MMNSQETIKFNNKDYTNSSLSEMQDEKLLMLRNLVAENLGVARIKSFKNHDQAVDATWKALQKWNSQDGASSGEAKASKKPAEPKAPPPPAKCAAVGTVKRPTRGMFRTLQKVKKHPGKGFRIRRWNNYKDGMTLLDCAEGDEMTPLDVGYYVEQGFMKLTEPTDEEYQSGLGVWYKKHNLENPAEAKAAKAKTAADAKAKRDVEREEKKKAADEKKVAKTKEREEAKIKKDAEIKTKKEAAEKAKADKVAADAKKKK